MVEVGKFTLESLTTGMYSDPRIVYREYIQNAVDSIEAAISEKTISEKEAFINVLIDSENGTIAIEDNGRGVSSKNAESVLLSIGKSTKRQENNRGFRGIGRLGGLSYCEKLVFITSFYGESVATKISFDCKQLRELLSPDHDEELDLQSVIQRITHTESFQEEAYEHYFRVEMSAVDMSSELLKLDVIRQYLSEVAPVPYNTRQFLVAPEIRRFLDGKGYKLTEFNVYVGYDEDHLEQVFKPNKYHFKSDRNKRMDDTIDEVVTFSIDLDGEDSLLGWYGRCNWNGTISDDELLGIRMRLGNILIGDRRTMDVMFKEHRFNGWVQGEIFVNTKGLIPNARRDDFEQNDVYYKMINELQERVGDVIIKEIREASKNRNNPDVRLLKEIDKTSDKVDKLVDEGLYSQKDKEQLTDELKEAEKKLARVSQKNPQVAEKRKEIAEKLADVQEKVGSTTNYKINNEISAELDKKQKKILKIVFESLSEYLSREMVEIIYNGIMDNITGKKRQ
ncbi:molecular chaperone HtpG [Lachnospiraceae bacterium]|nr:molecular chaperone HtpG [Lachnospiraceae bacterium]